MDGPHLFRVAEARAKGMRDRQLRARNFVIPTRGVRALRELVDAKTLLAALALVARDDHFFSHTTAARIHGMPLPLVLVGDGIHVAAPTAGSRMRRPGMIAHRLRADTVIVDGLRVEAPADVFIHLAALLDHASLVAVADWLVSHQRGDARITPQDLLEHCRRRSATRGSAAARRAVLDCRVGAESPMETEFRLVLGELGMPTTELNFSIFDEGKRFLMRPDGGWPELRCAWEYDGEQHFTDPRQAARDLDRLEAPAALGWRTRRFAKQHLRGRREAIVAFADEVRERARLAQLRPIELEGYWSTCLDPRTLRR
ncbi:hypothetical protein ABIB37_001628 [Agrococcus sp. UYP10]|uniref:hypothetical protein n=1 Tax=Agrococcus sp. UYP10 TaxID=1756355 RepID=UPI003396A1B7